jgi:YkoP-like protein
MGAPATIDSGHMTAIDSRAANRAGLPRSAPSADVRSRPGLIATLVHRLDVILRRRMKIWQFCTDRRCVIRLALTQATDAVCLADGTHIRIGDLVGDIHFWNEQMPRMSESGPCVAWALAMHRSFGHSMDILARHVEGNPRFEGIEAFRAMVTFGGPPTRASKIGRVMAWHGFEIIERKPTFVTTLQALVAGLFVRCMLYGFNPAGLKRGGLRRHSYEFWISKRRLLERLTERTVGARAAAE